MPPSPSDSIPPPSTDSIPPPSPESFVNEVFHSVVDSSFSSYYLVVNADTCRFMKYDYDEWIKYHLKESVPITTLNELSEKVYLSRNYPYHWQQARLHLAICISPAKADSIFTLANPSMHNTKTRRKQILKEWQHLPAQAKTVFSFSLPHHRTTAGNAVIGSDDLRQQLRFRPHLHFSQDLRRLATHRHLPQLGQPELSISHKSTYFTLIHTFLFLPLSSVHEIFTCPSPGTKYCRPAASPVL